MRTWKGRRNSHVTATHLGRLRSDVVSRVGLWLSSGENEFGGEIRHVDVETGVAHGSGIPELQGFWTKLSGAGGNADPNRTPLAVSRVKTTRAAVVASAEATTPRLDEG